jgi:uncharacterized protein (UPF0264 family)
MQLLVSVRDATEAAAALAGGVDYIDVKEPTRGALGYADSDVLCAVAAAVGDRVPISAALGEITAPLPTSSLSGLAKYRYAKVGLAGACRLPDWPQVWRSLVSRLPQSVRPVAVIYADAENCDAPSFFEILPHARALACDTILVDTFAKDGKTIFDFVSEQELREMLAAAHCSALRTVLAGSLRLSDLAQVASLTPNIVAVRGAVCNGGRSGAITAQRVREFRLELARNSQCSNRRIGMHT